jgi:hypothetical protein
MERQTEEKGEHLAKAHLAFGDTEKAYGIHRQDI